VHASGFIKGDDDGVVEKRRIFHFTMLILIEGSFPTFILAYMIREVFIKYNIEITREENSRLSAFYIVYSRVSKQHLCARSFISGY